MTKAGLIELVGLCDRALAELKELRDSRRELPAWTPLMRPDAYWFMRTLGEAAGLALEAGAPAHYQRLTRLCESPWSAAERRYLLTEMTAAAAECRLWALDQCGRVARAMVKRRKPPARRPRAGGKGKKGEDRRRVRLRAIPVNPGKRLRGGREILEAMEGSYTYARWRAFKREALKYGAPIEWPPPGGMPRAYENVLKLWLAERVEAAERARAERETRDRRKAEFDTSTGRYAYPAGGGQPLGIVRRPGGRKGR